MTSTEPRPGASDAANFSVQTTAIEGVVVVTSFQRTDLRGAFSRLSCAIELAPIYGARGIVQINHSRTARVGAVRGLHYQHPPFAEMKLVRCVRGRLMDVALDLRKGSPSFLNFHAVELTPTNGRMLVIPEGCAHGFQVLEAESELLYLHTAPYSPEHEGGVHCQDPRLAIPWPLEPVDLSARDRGFASLGPDFSGLCL